MLEVQKVDICHQNLSMFTSEGQRWAARCSSSSPRMPQARLDTQLPVLHHLCLISFLSFWLQSSDPLLQVITPPAPSSQLPAQTVMNNKSRGWVLLRWRAQRQTHTDPFKLVTVDQCRTIDVRVNVLVRGGQEVSFKWMLKPLYLFRIMEKVDENNIYITSNSSWLYMYKYQRRGISRDTSCVGKSNASSAR